jgi:hypothetical protein
MMSDRIEPILLITGLATAGALALFLWPVTMMKMLFGQAPSDALSLLIARHWGLLIGLVGALLIFAAYHTETRVPTLIVAIGEKAAFALGVLSSPFRRRWIATLMALADAGMAAMYLMYLLGLSAHHWHPLAEKPDRLGIGSVISPADRYTRREPASEHPVRESCLLILRITVRTSRTYTRDSGIGRVRQYAGESLRESRILTFDFGFDPGPALQVLPQATMPPIDSRGNSSSCKLSLAVGLACGKAKPASYVRQVATMP